MSESGQLFRGRPNSLKDRANQAIIYAYCGGGGAGGTPPQFGITGVVLEYKVSKNIVGNRKIVFEVDDLYGLSAWTDAGLTTPANIYMGLSDVSTDDIETTAKAGGVTLTGFGPYNVEFDQAHCPQPYLRPDQGDGPNPDWSSRVFVYLWWGNASYYNGAAMAVSPDYVLDERAFNFVKHDNDIRI